MAARRQRACCSDWAEDHHDVEIVDNDGKRLGRARLPEGMAGMARLHALVGEHLDDDALDPETGMLAPGRVVVVGSPLAGSTRRSLNRGATTSTAPAEVSTSRD